MQSKKNNLQAIQNKKGVSALKAEKENQNNVIYVLNKDGQPLMPTSRHGKVKHLLKDGKAKVVRCCPFTIQLLYEGTNYTQKLTLGVDTGAGTLGTAVTNDKGEVLYASKVEVRNDIHDKMVQRSKYRRNRRFRKTRYRKARFLNRKNSIKKDRFSPTMVSKFHTHIKEVEFVKSILPIGTIVFECGQFDTHLMKNPSLANEKIRHWGYQKGPNYGFANTREMVLNRDGYKCKKCKGKSGSSRLEVHHILYKGKGGSDKAENLITLCHECHKSLHEGEFQLNLKGKPKGQLKYATQMNSIRCQLLKRYPEAVETYGYVTKENRFVLGLEKDHHIDAAVIALGNTIQQNQEEEKDTHITFRTFLYEKKSVSKGDYQQTKGPGSKQKLNTKKINGFKKFDKVKYLGKEYFIKGRMSSGYAFLMDIHGEKADFSNFKVKTPKLANCKRIAARKSTLVIQSVI
jgi:5-methylcytosine-specific restriction endonuclease McrA